MPHGIVHFFEGATKEQYDATLRAVHPGAGLPEGQIFHAAGPTEGGWVVVAIHDSEESWNRFLHQTLLPRMASGIEGGVTGPPEERTFDVQNHVTA
ncbi:MAG TPA: hypothetical protein VNT51_13945 [Miltoncostaeaceae bacterium]|nr:hypothetical protein [Miltoncostaeaceae bacterium]